MNNKPKADKILIVRTDRIGDVLLSTPVIKALRDAYPKSHIAFMVRPYARDIVEGNPFLDEVIVYDKDNAQKGFLSSLKFAFNLRKKKFDLAVILHPTNRVHLITWLAGIRQRIGLNRKLGFLLSSPAADEKHLGLMHEVDYNLGLLNKIGITAGDRSLFMPVGPDNIGWAEKILKENKIDKSRPVICVHPAASCISKRWPLENFAGLIKRLEEEFKAQIIIFVSNEDGQIADELCRLSGNKAACVLKGVSLSCIAALLKKSNLLISNDSGPVHISVAVGTPVIAVFGRKQPGLSPKRWGPIGKKDIVLHKDAGCEVCLAHNCGRGFECLKAVGIEDVLNAVRKII